MRRLVTLTIAAFALALPSAALAPEVSWRSLDTHRAVATVRVGSGTQDVTVTVGPDGALTESVMQRWGPLGHGAYGTQPFGATLHEELVVDGMRIPRRITAGWHYGTDRWAEGEFFRYAVTRLDLLQARGPSPRARARGQRTVTRASSPRYLP